MQLEIDARLSEEEEAQVKDYFDYCTLDELKECEEEGETEVLFCFDFHPASRWEPGYFEKEYFKTIRMSELPNWKEYFAYRQTLERLKHGLLQ